VTSEANESRVFPFFYGIWGKSKSLSIPYVCPYKCLKTCDFHTAPYCIAAALRNAQNGLLDQGFAFTGANAHRVKQIVSVEQLMSELQQGYSEAVDKVQESCMAVTSIQ
jgi:hypothetical protein